MNFLSTQQEKFMLEFYAKYRTERCFMKIVSINNLKPGMVISEDVFSYHGQCLAKQNTPVTLQLIEH